MFQKGGFWGSAIGSNGFRWFSETILDIKMSKMVFKHNCHKTAEFMVSLQEIVNKMVFGVNDVENLEKMSLCFTTHVSICW